MSEDSREFYRELTDTWSLAGCSLFVLGWALPWLYDGKVGSLLDSTLKSYLNLIQYKTNNADLFPKHKEELLMQRLISNSDRVDHLRFLTGMEQTASLQIIENPFLSERLRGLRPASLLTDDQAQPENQVARDL